MILILGMPRSGTSKLCNILESFGYNFKLNPDDLLDNIYLPHTQFYQSKKLHIEIGKTNAVKFERCTTNNDNIVNLLNIDIIKEPYLLFLLNSIRHKIKKIILIIRHPFETISSSKNFLKLNNTDQQISYNEWNKYYLTFLEDIKDTPYIIVNYNNFQYKYDYEINRIKTFLEINNEHNKNNTEKFQFINNYKYISEDIPSVTKYIYNNLISEDKNKYDNIVKNYKNFINLKPNEKCFCNSGKKYKKCCNITGNL